MLALRPFYWGGGGGSGSSTPSYHDVKRNFYVHTILSADETIEHWEEAVEAGKSVLWDALSVKISEVAIKQIDEYAKTLEKTQNQINEDLDAQYNRIKTGKEAVVSEAAGFKSDMEIIANDLSFMQKAILGQADGAV